MAPVMQQDAALQPFQGSGPDAGDPMFVSLPSWGEAQHFRDQSLTLPTGLCLNRDSKDSQCLPVVGDMFPASVRAIDARWRLSSASTTATEVQDVAAIFPPGRGDDQNDDGVEAKGLPQKTSAAVIEGQVEQADDTKVWANSVITSLKGKNGSHQKGKVGSGDLDARVRWWVRPDLPLLCPITRFPICFLPYPPFKLRVDPKRSNRHRLVDGKFLAMQVVVTNNRSACGRQLEVSDLKALDDYVHRCKLGPFRPGREAVLANAVADATTPKARRHAAQEHANFLSAARAELEKLCRIQENRLLQATAVQPERLARQSGPQPQQQRHSSGTSTALLDSVVAYSSSSSVLNA